MSITHVYFDDMVWPKPDKGMDDLDWKLRYGNPSREELLAAASIVSAYSSLISSKTQRECIRIKRQIMMLEGI